MLNGYPLTDFLWNSDSIPLIHEVSPSYRRAISNLKQNKKNQNIKKEINYFQDTLSSCLVVSVQGIDIALTFLFSQMYVLYVLIFGL